MTLKLETTSVPGIYKRGGKYVVRYRAGGRRYAETVATMAEARRMKRERERSKDRGEFELVAASRRPFAEYARDWIDSYQGNGRHGFTDETREDYRRDLERVLAHFERSGRSVAGVGPADIDGLIAWLCDEEKQGQRLSDATIRRILAPLRACFSTARRHGLIRSNPVDGAKVPHRPEIQDEEPRARTLSREQLDTVMRVVHPDHRVMVRLVAATGLRWGEAAALRRSDLILDGSNPRVRVRRTVTKGGRFKPPKSRHGRRDVPLSRALVGDLRRHLANLPGGDPDGVAFPSKRGTPLAYPNMLRRRLRPAVEEAGAPWAAYHSLRHTFASLHLARGTNIVQLSRLLGHHSPDFTLRRYAHLIPGDDVPALDLGAELDPDGESRVSPDRTGLDVSPQYAHLAETAS
jgi:integrase